jgi:hypothetical protein
MQTAVDRGDHRVDRTRTLALLDVREPTFEHPAGVLHCFLAIADRFLLIGQQLLFVAELTFEVLESKLLLLNVFRVATVVRL